MDKKKIAEAMINKDLTYERALSLIENCKDEREAILLLSGEHVNLALYAANKYRTALPQGIIFDDIVSDALFALTKAASTYKVDSKNKFSTYAMTCINNEILQDIRNNKKHSFIKSLEEPIKDLKSEDLILKDVIEETSDIIEDFIAYDTFKNFLKSTELNDIEKKLLFIRLKYGETINRTETAKMLGVSQGYVSRVAIKLKNKLKKYLDNTDKKYNNYNIQKIINDYLDKNYINLKSLKNKEIIEILYIKVNNRAKKRETIANYFYKWKRNNISNI